MLELWLWSIKNEVWFHSLFFFFWMQSSTGNSEYALLLPLWEPLSN